MPFNEQQALDGARHLLSDLRGTLPYHVRKEPRDRRLVEGGLPPRVVPGSATVGSIYWQFDFEYEAGRQKVDPSGVRIFVDRETGAPALYWPPHNAD